MRILEMIVRVPIRDLGDDERTELLEQTSLGDEEALAEGLPDLAEYTDAGDRGAEKVAEAVVSAIRLAQSDSFAAGEMFAGSEVYVTIDQEPEVEVTSAVWVDEP